MQCISHWTYSYSQTRQIRRVVVKCPVSPAIRNEPTEARNARMALAKMSASYNHTKKGDKYEFNLFRDLFSGKSFQNDNPGGMLLLTEWTTGGVVMKHVSACGVGGVRPARSGSGSIFTTATEEPSDGIFASSRRGGQWLMRHVAVMGAPPTGQPPKAATYWFFVNNSRSLDIPLWFLQNTFLNSFKKKTKSGLNDKKTGWKKSKLNRKARFRSTALLLITWLTYPRKQNN